MVLQKIGFVDIEKTPVRPGEETRFERLFATRQRPFQIERADDAILRRPKRQVHDRNRPQLGFQSAFPRAGLARFAKPGGRSRITVIGASGHGAHLRQQRRERPDGRRFAGAAIPEDENAPDRGINGAEHESQFHVVLADDRGEGIGRGRLARQRGRRDGALRSGALRGGALRSGALQSGAWRNEAGRAGKWGGLTFKLERCRGHLWLPGPTPRCPVHAASGRSLALDVLYVTLDLHFPAPGRKPLRASTAFDLE